MTISLNTIGQIMLPVADVDLAETFFSETLGLHKLYRFGNLLFYDCAGIRLLVEKSASDPFVPGESIIYFRVADIHLVYNALKAKDVHFIDEPHLVAPMEDHDLWMAFFNDPSSNTLALMQEAPKGYS